MNTKTVSAVHFLRRITASAVILLTVQLAFTGCGTDITIGITDSDSAVITFSADLGQKVSDTILSLTGHQTNEQMFNAESIQKSLTGAGLSSVTVTQHSASASLPGNAINVTGTAPAISKGFAKVPGLITVTSTASPSGTKHSFVAALNPTILQQTVALLPEETRSYLDLLAAPVLSTEKEDQMSADEYLDLIGAMYGETMAAEMRAAKVTLTFVPPASAANARKAVYSIPLAELLTLQKTKLFSLNW